MKKIIFLILALILMLTGCAGSKTDFDNLSENYSTVVSMPYSSLIGQNIGDISDKAGKLTFDEKSGCYYSDKTLLEFTPYFITDDDGIVKITGFETTRKTDENIVTYIHGLQNFLSARYGNVKIDSSITQRVNSIKDISMCKDGESYKEAWEMDGFPVEYMVSFENGNTLIKIQYNKLVDIK